jgi:tetratricopeptide (TPR) repeat protein
MLLGLQSRSIPMDLERVGARPYPRLRMKHLTAVLLLVLGAVALTPPASAAVHAAPRAAASPAPAADLGSLLARHPADSLVVPLRRFEAEHGREPQGGEAALMLGRLHFARGEYAQAAAAFARAAARLDPARKPEARYWSGLAWLALKQPEQARAALEEVATSASPRASEARLGIALAWELANRPDRAYDELDRLLQRDPGEAGPAALERFAALAERLHRGDVAVRARARLMRDYPRSIEAATASADAPERARSGSGAIEVQIGAFASEARARSLLQAARRAGFRTADVVARGEGAARLYHVRLGAFANATAAREAGESAAKKLGVTYRLAGPER